MIGETILVIDSDAETTQNIVSTLEAEDYLVFTAPSGEIGITMAKKVNPVLIFVNPAMAGTSGLEICKTIHGIEPLKNVPIIAFSAFEGVTDPRYATLYGIIDSLKKPFSPEELISKTRNVLSMKSVEVQPAVEEEIGFGESQEALAIEEPEITKIQKEFAEEIEVSAQTVVKHREDIESDKTVVKQMKEEMEEKTEHIQIPSEETTEIIGEREKTYVLKKSMRRRGVRNRLFVPIIIAIVIIVIFSAAGIVLYKKGLLPGTKVPLPVAVKPSRPVQQQVVKVAPPQEQQKPQQPVAESKPAQAPAPAPAPPMPAQAPTAKPSPAPAPKVIPEAKPAGKAIYSVQIGAFKNWDNAEALIKQYKEKGYEAFIYKSTRKDKEILYRVLIGKFENKKEASKLTKNINAKENIKAIIFRE